MFHRVKNLRFLFCAIACVCVVARAADIDTIEQRALPCTPCHGKEGRAAVDGYYPRIAGKPAEYLFNQLLNFRDGRRFFPMMNYLTERQQEDFLQELAGYFASQELPYAAPVPPKVSAAVLDRGHRLVTDGDAAVKLPACVACHGTNLMGTLPAVPGLIGVSQYYLDAQIAAWKNGTRQAKAPDCMARIAKQLSTEDIGAVTAWLSSQVVPDGARPQAQPERPPPIECGSMQVTGAARAGKTP